MLAFIGTSSSKSVKSTPSHMNEISFLGVFRIVNVEWDVSWESISYGEILIVVCDGWRVRLPRRRELKDDVRSLDLPRRSVRHVVEGHFVQFDPQALKMGTDPEAQGPNGRGL